MIITYFDRKDDFKVKTCECYAVMPLVGNSEVLVKSKGLDPVFILTEDVIYISEDISEDIDNELISRSALAREVFSHTYSVPILETENKVLCEVLQMIHNAPPVEPYKGEERLNIKMTEEEEHGVICPFYSKGGRQ